ncbi:ABC transporter ATP-binding protein [Amycolatopsis pigmentata]|uniref:ABC transporter ATP-binding protein n=1 Tax=Amycolatopsis pigmentata TaxID=450801 RepID=A0ABW5FN84_9PSEU
MNTVLSCSSLTAGYAGNPVVRDFALELGEGEVLALLGPNGAGKTTVLRTLAGLLPRIGGQSVVTGRPGRGGSRGVVLVPDHRALFTTLTVGENLLLGRRSGGPSVNDILGYFPELGKRLDVAAGKLSGGEQQMLAIGRALIQRPRVLLIDEMSMGLAPVVVQALLPVVRQVADRTGAAVVLVEQHVRFALSVADRAMVLVHGRVSLSGRACDLAADPALLERAYLGEAV